jgi:hypothetical protein
MQIKTLKMVVRQFLVGTMKIIIPARLLGFQCDEGDIGKSALTASLSVKKLLNLKIQALLSTLELLSSLSHPTSQR